MDLRPSTGTELVNLLEWRMMLDGEGVNNLRTASLDPVPRAVHGGDGRREAILQLMHPRGAAMVDLRMRSTTEGRLARHENIARHVGVNHQATSYMIEIALSTLNCAMRLPADERGAIRRHWADLAGQDAWPWRKVWGARHGGERHLRNAVMRGTAIPR